MSAHLEHRPTRPAASAPDVHPPVPRPAPSRWLALLLVACWGLLSAWWIPRGPTSTAETLICLGISLLVGFLVGAATHSRWAVLASPAAFAVVYEVARWHVEGPSVDRPFWSMYGLIALVTGRLFHGLVTLFPLAWGAAAGAASARMLMRRNRPRVPGSARWRRVTGGLGLATTGMLLIALGWVAARPASTAPIVGADGQPVPGSIAELTSVPANGHDLGVMIRGRSQDNPVLLFLAGGPGGSELGAMRRHLTDLEQYVTVATLDQRGTGRSYGELDPIDTLSVESSINDVLAVTDYLRDRFGQPRIHLVGQSWGTTLGVLTIQRAPDRFTSFIGVGQMVSQRATDEIMYRDKLAWAERTGQDGLVRRLRGIGPPPYTDPRNYELALSGELEVHPYDHSGNSEGSGQMSENILVPEYSLTEQVRLLSATLDTFTALYPQLQEIDFRQTATRLEVPVFFVQGAHEAPGRAEPFEQWYEALQAPTKDVIVLPTSGHRPMFEQPSTFVDYVTRVVLPGTERTAQQPGGT